MKILFYSHSATKYGATSSMTNLIMGINKLYPEINVHVILPKKGPLVSHLREYNIPFSVIPHQPWFYNYNLSTKKKKENFFLWKIWFLKNKWQKRLLNSTHLKRHLNFAEQYLPDLIYVNSSLSPMGTIVASKLSIPFIWHHRETVNDKVNNFWLEYPKQFNRKFKEARLHVFPSKFLRQTYKDIAPSQGDFVVFNGVNYREERMRKEVPSNFSKLRFGMVGRINSQKGQAEVMKLFLRLKEASNDEFFKYELHLIGGGGKHDEPKDSKFYNHIHFHGFLNREEIYKKFDFLIMNSTNEAFGRVVAEANLYGIPVLAKRSGALPEIIKDGVNGYLYDGPEDLLNILQSFEQNMSVKKYIELAEGSRKEFVENFTIEDHTIKIVEKIKTII